jgi:hypothetical protein
MRGGKIMNTGIKSEEINMENKCPKRVQAYS